MTAPFQALCCVCAQLRTYKRARNQRGYWGDRNWHRSIGDLKCTACGAITTHALLNDRTDWDEKLQLLALGITNDQSWSPEHMKSVQAKYRQSNYPRNPFVTHEWWTTDEDEARLAGKKWFTAMCGEAVEVPESRSDGVPLADFQAPTQVTDPQRTEHENLDAESGLWWTQDGTCVNCLRVRHNWLLDQRRKDLALRLIKIAGCINDVDSKMIQDLDECTADMRLGDE